jgi:hypothetical protein
MNDDDEEIGDYSSTDPDVLAEGDAPATGAQIPASWMWGSSTTMTIVSAGPTAAQTASGQLANVQLPEPAVCSLYFQATIIRRTLPVNLVQAYTVNLVTGLGRVVVPRQLAYLAQPAFGSPLEVTIPFVPLHSLQVNLEALGQGIGAGQELVIETYFTLAPITRINEKTSPLLFGMAQPGEADAMDHEMREELEAESPTVQQILTDEQSPQQRVEIVRSPRQRLIERVIVSLEQRLGRRPTKGQVRAALARIDQRNATRFSRFGR